MLLKIAGILALITLGFSCFVSASDRQIAANRNYSAPAQHFWGGPGQARALALYAIESGDLRWAESNADMAVRLDPIGQRTTSLLGRALLAGKKNAKAIEAFTVAASLGWRDQLTQQFWESVAQSAGDYNEAAKRVDALLRVGSQGPETNLALKALEASPGGRSAIATRLASNAPWSRFYVDGLHSLPTDVNIATRISILLRASAMGSKFDCSVIAGAAQALVARGSFANSSALWFPLCRASQKAQGGISNGDFENAITTSIVSPFDWKLVNSGEINSVIVARPRSKTGKALHIESTSSTQEIAARQFLVLKPGRYMLSWELIETAGSGAVTIAIACADSRKRLNSQSVSQLTDGRLGSEFTVPSQSCDGQLITVWIAPGIGSASRASYVDDLRIEQVPAD